MWKLVHFLNVKLCFRHEIFLSFKAPKLSLEHTQSPVQCVWWAHPLGRENNPSPLTTAGVKNPVRYIRQDAPSHLLYIQTPQWKWFSCTFTQTWEVNVTLTAFRAEQWSSLKAGTLLSLVGLIPDWSRNNCIWHHVQPLCSLTELIKFDIWFNINDCVSSGAQLSFTLSTYGCIFQFTFKQT